MRATPPLNIFGVFPRGDGKFFQERVLNADLKIDRKSIIMAITEEGGVGPRMFQQLLMRLGAPEDFLTAAYPDFEDIPRLGEKGIARLKESLDNVNVFASRLKSYESDGIGVTTYLDHDYPEILRKIDDPPPVLYYKGDIDAWDQEYIAMVGTTRPTQAGIRLAVDLARELVRRGFGIISGLALGIDGAAHLGAIKENGRTIAVLGCGIMEIYPAENVPLAESIMKKGLIISEYSPYKPVGKSRLVLRNRLISALSRAVIVVETNVDTRGELRTAGYALKQARPLFYGVPDGTLNDETIGEYPGVIINDVDSVDEILKYLV